MDLQWIATCPEETREVLVGELAALGARAIAPGHRAIRFAGDRALGYRAHLALRTASRLQRVIGAFPATAAEEVTAGARGIDWASVLRPDRTWGLEVHLGDAPARALGEPVVADAFRAAIAAAPGAPPPGDDPQVTVVVHLHRGACTVGVDTAGKALHKRGWRVPGHPAVLKETLAAAILLLAGYDGSEPLYDPMCGSGTLLVEGAYLALGKGPLVHRKRGEFALEHLADFDRACWRRVGEEVRAARLPEPPAPLFGSDADDRYVEVARQGALRARVEKHLSLSTGRFEALPPPASAGLLVANLPYGERLSRGGLAALYPVVGRTIRERYAGWRLALLAPRDAPLGALGLRFDRAVPLHNGAVPVSLLLREEGSVSRGTGSASRSAARRSP